MENLGEHIAGYYDAVMTHAKKKYQSIGVGEDHVEDLVHTAISLTLQTNSFDPNIGSFVSYFNQVLLNVYLKWRKNVKEETELIKDNDRENENNIEGEKVEEGFQIPDHSFEKPLTRMMDKNLIEHIIQKVDKYVCKVKRERLRRFEVLGLTGTKRGYITLGDFVRIIYYLYLRNEEFDPVEIFGFSRQTYYNCLKKAGMNNMREWVGYEDR